MLPLALPKLAKFRERIDEDRLRVNIVAGDAVEGDIATAPHLSNLFPVEIEKKVLPGQIN